MSTIPFEARIAEFGPSKLHYRVSGSASNLPDIVLDHGGGGSADDWNIVAPLLAAHGRVFSYDRAGMGDSPSDGLGCSAPAVSQRLAQWVQHAGVRKPFILVGYSLGGLYARHYAQVHPQDVAALVLVDTTPTAYEVPQRLMRQAMRLLWLLHWIARLGLGMLYWHLKDRKTDKAKFKRAVARIAAPGWVQRMREETGAITEIQAEVARVAPQLRHPTLAVLAGNANNMAPEDFARIRGMHDQLAAIAPAPLSRQVVVEGAHHGNLVSNAEYAAQLADHILAFARSLPPIR